MQAYLAVAFWSGILSVLVRTCWLVGEHPRIERTNIGTDTFCWLLSVGFLAWVSYLKFWS